MVYIYRRYDTDKIEKKHKCIIAGGALSVAGVMFGAICANASIDGLSISFSIPGYTLIKLCSDYAGSEATMLLFVLLLAPVLGALLLVNSLMTLRGMASNIRAGYLMAAGIVSAIVPLLLYFVFMNGVSGDGLSLVEYVLDGNVRVLPGIGSIMQIAGGCFAAISAKSIANEERC